MFVYFSLTIKRDQRADVTYQPVTKCRSAAVLRVAAVGKQFTLIALAGVVAVHEGYLAAVRYGADL